MSKKKGKAKQAIGLLFMLLSLTSCGRLKSNHAIEAGIREILPDAVILNVETGTRSKGHKFKRFTVDNKGIIFTFENYQAADTMFSGTVAFTKDNYAEKLFEYFAQEIGEILQKYHIEIDGRLSGSSIYLKNRISDMAGLDASVDALEEIYRFVEDYIPKETLDWFPFEIKLWTLYGERELIIIEKQGDWDYSYYQQLLHLNFKNAVDMGLVKDVELPEEMLASIPQKYIRALYINGEPYQSDRYEIRFLYNLEDKRYYAPVGFGIDIEYNGGVEDHLQREIIKAYYPDSGYSISMKEQTTTYQIGDDHYLIERQRDSLTFYKNGRKLQIENYLELSSTHTGAAYFFWISVDDFASIMGMSVEKVEDDGVYLRMK